VIGNWIFSFEKIPFLCTLQTCKDIGEKVFDLAPKNLYSLLFFGSICASESLLRLSFMQWTQTGFRCSKSELTKRFHSEPPSLTCKNESSEILPLPQDQPFLLCFPTLPRLEEKEKANPLSRG